MGAKPGLDFIRRKWLHVIINDYFLEKGECYGLALLPSIICLGRLRIASKYIFNLWQLRQGVDSLAQWLEHWIFNLEDRVRFPRKAEYFFSYASFLCYGYHVVRGLIVEEILNVNVKCVKGTGAQNIGQGQDTCRVSTSRRSTMQGLVARGLTLEEIWNVDVN